MTCEKYIKHIRVLIRIVKTSFHPMNRIKAPLKSPCIDPIFGYQLKKSLKMFFEKAEQRKVDLLFFINMKLMLVESSKIV